MLVMALQNFFLQRFTVKNGSYFANETWLLILFGAAVIRVRSVIMQVTITMGSRTMGLDSLIIELFKPLKCYRRLPSFELFDGTTATKFIQ